MNVTIRILSKHADNENEYDGVISRDSLRRMYSFKCKFTGYEAMINLNGDTIIVPGVYFSEYETNILPSGSPIIIPSKKLVKWQIRARPYLQADVIVQDETLTPAPIVTPAPTVTPVPTRSIIPVFPGHIKQLILADSISKNESCAITGESINQENACITTCGHVFTKDGLTRWLSVSSNQSCPICRQSCSLA
jgi:hypothetical protein